LAQSLRDWTTGLTVEGAAVVVVGTLLLILFHENCSSGDFRTHFSRYFGASAWKGLYPAFYWYGCSLLVLGLVPLLFGRLALGVPLREWGVGLGDYKFGLKAVLVMYLLFLPVLILVSTGSAFQAKYPLFPDANRTVLHLVVYQLAYAVYFIGWEFIFRGFLLFGLKPHIGFWAVFVQTIPFAILHFGKPQIETIAAVFAGILLGYLALRTRSFWYGWLLHASIATTNDLLALHHKGWW
jgi:membrane protease YdiL (CAAX protease family)